MALVFDQYIRNGGRLGIWKIEEQESFFLEKLSFPSGITHPYKRLQHLAGRYVLKTLAEHFPVEEIKIADNKKPFLSDNLFHFSISHCGNYAAAIIHEQQPVGIDIELVTPRIHTISPKFLHIIEREYLSEFKHMPGLYLELETVIWSAKEAVFKWYGKGKVDFKNHITLSQPIRIGVENTVDLHFMFTREEPVEIKIKARLLKHLVLAYIVH